MHAWHFSIVGASSCLFGHSKKLKHLRKLFLVTYATVGHKFSKQQKITSLIVKIEVFKDVKMNSTHIKIKTLVEVLKKESLKVFKWSDKNGHHCSFVTPKTLLRDKFWFNSLSAIKWTLVENSKDVWIGWLSKLVNDIRLDRWGVNVGKYLQRNFRVFSNSSIIPELKWSNLEKKLNIVFCV